MEEMCNDCMFDSGTLVAGRSTGGGMVFLKAARIGILRSELLVIGISQVLRRRNKRNRDQYLAVRLCRTYFMWTTK